MILFYETNVQQKRASQLRNTLLNY